MIELKSITYITTDDIEKLISVHWSDCEFAQMAENDSYARLDCSDAGLEELYEALEWENKKGNLPKKEDYEDPEEYEWKLRHCRANRLINQIALVEKLRKTYGIRFEILVWVCW